MDRPSSQGRRISPNGPVPLPPQRLDEDLVLVELEDDVGQPPALFALDRVAVV